jgi:hypothetical protein
MPGLVHADRINRVHAANNWFTESEIARSVHAWSTLLTDKNLTCWTGAYDIPAISPMRNIRVITAGNIPLVGFHDFLSVLITGNRFIGKLSSRDDVLLAILANELIRIEPSLADHVQLDDDARAPDAVIATGSNNSARYFQMEYGHLPHIIRKNRSSAAILDGTETGRELESLPGDILEYHGLGCRSVSHIFLPESYSPENLARLISGFSQVDLCEPFIENLRYQRARLAMLNIPYTDAQQVLLVESEMLHSPIGLVHYSFYSDINTLFRNLKSQDSEIQCLVGHDTWNPDLIPFGSAQKPELWDYADDNDTVDFLVSL